MNAFTEILKNLKSVVTDIPDVEISEINDEEYIQKQADWYNSTIGNLDKIDGINCNICRNKGNIEVVINGQSYMRDCDCMTHRRTVRALQISGLSLVLERTFEKFNAEDDWQIKAKAMAMKFSGDNDDKWLYFGGQSGCGKTHLCTAVCKSLMSYGRRIKYMLWDDISHKIDAYKFKEEEYADFMNCLKSADVLYIDDFLKTPTSKDGVPQPPDMHEVKNAYIVINARDLAGKKTILSSEHFLTEYENYDCATASRIKYNSSCIIQINRKPDRNYRKKVKQRE